MKQILVIDDDTNICLLLERFLVKKGFEVKYVHHGKDAILEVEKNKYDLCLCDFKLPDMDGYEVIAKLKEHNKELPIIIITGYSDVRNAVTTIKMGVFDYVTKPLFPDEILLTINKALEFLPENSSSTSIKSSNPKATKINQIKEFIDGKSQAMADVMNMVKIVAPTNISVLIQGETGVGKEYIARAIHNSSERKNGPFIAVDCGAIPKDLASSELFGHIKGAFTSAINNRVGHFESANGGTLFLDEIGNLSYDTQVKILRAIQERVVSKVGETKAVQVDVRIIAASNENLINSVKEGHFREDLYHRLNEIKIVIPPLRERPEDILIYAHYFLDQSNSDLNKSVTGFDKEFENMMLQYPWHGNLRELKNIIKRCTLLTQKSTLSVDTLPHEILQYKPEHLEIALINDFDLKGASSTAERATILNILAKVNYNKSKAAIALNIDRKTLYNKMRQLNISPEETH